MSEPKPKRWRITQFAKGYQTAMHDVLDIWEREGAEAALTYARNNAVLDPEERNS